MSTEPKGDFGYRLATGYFVYHALKKLVKAWMDAKSQFTGETEEPAKEEPDGDPEPGGQS